MRYLNNFLKFKNIASQQKFFSFKMNQGVTIMPTLLLIDIQKEYTTEERPFYLNNIDHSIENCKKMLTHARENAWRIIHVQHSNGPSAPRFNPNEPFFKFVDGFEPLVGEEHYVKNDFSCYSNTELSSRMDEIASGTDEKIYMIGYNSVMCCLSTLEEARRRKHKITFVSDASLAKDIGIGNEEAMHEVMLKLYQAKTLAEIKKTAEILPQPSLTVDGASLPGTSSSIFYHSPSTGIGGSSRVSTLEFS